MTRRTTVRRLMNEYGRTHAAESGIRQPPSDSRKIRKCWPAWSPPPSCPDWRPLWSGSASPREPRRSFEEATELGSRRRPSPPAVRCATIGLRVGASLA